MPPTIGGVTIDPQGQTLTVSITPAAKVYTDAAGTTLASFPATVTSRTSYWMTAAQPFTVSVKTSQGNEIADATGNPLVVDVQQGVMEGIAPVIDRPGPEDVAQSGTYVARANTGITTRYVDGTYGSDSSDGRDAGVPMKSIGAAAASLPQKKGRIVLAPGAIQLTGTVNLDTYTDLKIEGAGPNATSIVVNGNYSALTFSGVCSRITLRDLWIGSFAARASGYGLSVVGTIGNHSDSFLIENVLIQNTYQAMFANYLDQSILANVRYIQSIAAASGSDVFHFFTTISTSIRDMLVFSTTGGSLGGSCLLIDADCDTIVVDGGKFGNGSTSNVHLAQNGGTTGPRLIRLNDCYSESSAAEGYLISAGRDVRVRGCETANNISFGYSVTAGSGVHFAECSSIQTGQHGFILQGGSALGITGCLASDNGTGTPGGWDGIRIENNVTHARIIGNRSGNAIFATSNQRYGLSIGATGTDYIVAQANDLSVNVTGGLGNFSSGAHNVVGNNAT